MKYRLEKLEVKEGHSSAVRSGRVVTSEKCSIRKLEEGAEIVDNPEISDIEEGDMVMVLGRGFDFIKSSPITNIIEVDNNSLTFETITSIYKLEVFHEQ